MKAATPQHEAAQGHRPPWPDLGMASPARFAPPGACCENDPEANDRGLRPANRGMLHVLAISDGQPGHFNQSLGVVRALQRLQPVSVDWLEVSIRVGWLRKVVRTLLNTVHSPLPIEWLHWFYRLRPAAMARPDLIVSSGVTTLHVNAWLARTFGCRNLYSGTLRGLSQRYLAGVLSLDPSLAGDPRYLVGPLPTKIERDRVEQAAQQYRSDRALSAGRVWTLLVGGDGGGYTFAARDWQTLAIAVNELARKWGVRWLITTSRRTGIEVERELAARLSPDAVADLLLYGSDQRPLFEAFLGCAEAVFCTEDSASMMAEAVASGRPVYTLRPRAYRTGKQNQFVVSSYAEAGRIRRLDIADVTGHDFQQSLPEFPCHQMSPGDELALQLEAWLART